MTEGPEASLSSLLSKCKDDPWSLLMIQSLLWAFRRWAVHYLTSDELTSSMREFLWESHLDLIDRFAPEGLRDFALVWLNPSNLGDRVDMLQELNMFFLVLVDEFDAALLGADEVKQDSLARFIDEDITRILDRWLDGRRQYRIYPTALDSPDEFSAEVVYSITQTILNNFITKKIEEVKAAPPPSLPVPETLSADAQKPEPQPQTIKAALTRRRTLKNRNGKVSSKKTLKNQQ